MMSAGKTTGVFQFESAGMRRVLSQLVPESIEDLIAVVSLYRPGPSESIPKYINNKHNPDKITYKHPLLKNILDVTYGCIVYQEQVMEICRTLAGYSYGRADLVRRAMAKKKHDVMEKERHSFIYGDTDSEGKISCTGALANGVSEQTANKIFDEMSGFASYAFNKSHAAAYAYLAYQTAYLKCHYMKQYMSALMSSVLDNTDKLIEYAEECRFNGIAVLRPDINKSSAYFTSENDGIRYGLLAIKTLGLGVINEIIKERSLNGNYKSFHDFCKRTAQLSISKVSAEYLIKAGAFDGLGANRRQLMSILWKVQLIFQGQILRDKWDFSLLKPVRLKVIFSSRRKMNTAMQTFFALKNLQRECTSPDTPATLTKRLFVLCVLLMLKQ